MQTRPQPEIRIGPAGWSYRDWRGVVYPEKNPRGFHPATMLARYFDTIELNSTFYRTPDTGMARVWMKHVQQVNPRFKFTAKLLQAFTHQRNATQADEHDVKLYLDVLAEEERLGALLIQFPWSCRSTPENQAYLSQLADRFRNYPLAVEVRHASWNQPDVKQWMRERRLALCNIDQPVIGASLGPSDDVTANLAYVRLHGRNYENWFRDLPSTGEAAPTSAEVTAAATGNGKEFFAPREDSRRYDYLYSERELNEWTEKIQRIAQQATTTYVIANNHFEGKAVVNALQLEYMISGQRHELPASLVKRYPALAPIDEASPEFKLT